MMKSLPVVFSGAVACFMTKPSAGAVTLAAYVDGSGTSLAAVAGSPANISATNITGVGSSGNLGTTGSAIRSSYGGAATSEISTAFGGDGVSTKGYTLMSSLFRDGASTTAPLAEDLDTDANYFSFNITASGGTTFALTSLNFNLAMLSNSGTAISSSVAYQVYASVDGGTTFTAVGSSVVIPSTSYAAGTATTMAAQTVDLSSLNASEPVSSVQFRIWQGSSYNTSDSILALGYQDINVQGSVIPETSSALLGLAAASLLLRRKR